MWYSKYAIFLIIDWLLGILTIWFAMTEQLVLMILTFLMLVGVTAYPIVRYIYREKLIKSLCEVYSEPEEGHSERILKPVNGNCLQLTIRFKVTAHIRSIGLRFEKDGEYVNNVRIVDLNDWQRVDGGRPANINEPSEMKNGTWFWEYKEPHHRYPESRITIGIIYESSENIKGQLRVSINTVEVSKGVVIPFEV